MRLISSVHIVFPLELATFIHIFDGFFHFKGYSIDMKKSSSFPTHKVFIFLSKSLGYALEQLQHPPHHF